MKQTNAQTCSKFPALKLIKNAKRRNNKAKRNFKTLGIGHREVKKKQKEKQ